MSQTIDQVYRDYNTQGVPASGEHEPDKREIRALLKMIQNSGGQAVTRNTLSALNGVTPPTEGYMGVVLADPTASNNGYYYRSGSAWVFGRPFPDTFAEVALSGSGTAQTGAVDTGVNPSGVEVFFARVTTPNTGPMTLSISGEAARDVVNLAGNPLSAGEWTGIVMFDLNEDGDYQLLIDAGAAAAAAASASFSDERADDAEAAAVRAENAAASFSEIGTNFKTVANLLADTTVGYTGSGADTEVAAGDVVTAQGFRYEVAASDATDEHVETVGGVKLNVLRNVEGGVSILQFGARGNGSDIDTAAFADAAESLSTGGRLIIPEGRFLLDAETIWAAGTQIEIHPEAIIELSASSGASVFRWAGSQASETISPTADITRGSKSISVTAGEQAMFATGDVLKIETTDIFAPARLASIRDGELATVRSVSSGVINLFGTVKGNYLLANGTVTLRKIDMVNRPKVKGGKFIASGTNNGLMALRFGKAFMPLVEDVQFSGFDDRAVYLDDCIQPLVQRIYAEHSESEGTGYGVSVANATFGAKVLHSRFLNVRHAVSTGAEASIIGIPRFTKAFYNVVEYSAPANGGAGGDAFDTHACSSDTEYSFNEIYGATGIGMNIEDRNFTGRYNKIYNPFSHGISVATYPEEKGYVRLEGNEVYGAGGDGIRITGGITGNAVVSGVASEAALRKNTVEDAVGVSIYVRTITSGQKNERVILDGNAAHRGQNASSVVLVDGCEHLEYRGNGGRGNGGHFLRTLNCVDIVGDHGNVEFASDLNRRCVSLESVSGRTNLTGGRGKAAAGVGLNVANAVNNVTSVGYDAAACATPFNFGSGTGHQKGSTASP